jgi:hypothetical protein
MANPSTTGPSGIGTEVLKRVFLESASNVTTSLLTVATDHVYTVLSLFFENGQTATVNFSMMISGDGSGGVYVVKNQPVAQNGTFIFNDKFVLTEGDILKTISDSTDHDIWCSYIDQTFA